MNRLLNNVSNYDLAFIVIALVYGYITIIRKK
jgi:hypothetical protein